MKDFAKADFDTAGWKPAHVIGKFGIAPWGNAVPGGDGKPMTATAAESLTLVPGFKAELLYTVPKSTHGSWVAMTTDPKGRLIVSDQNGPLYRVTVGAAAADTKVEKIDLPIGHAQGLLYTNDSLYVVVNGGGIKGNGSGLYRLRDTDGDDQFDKLETLIKFQGAGEHGPHAVRQGPDGKLYIVAGNFTKPPERLSANSQHVNFAEDLLLPRNPDGGGHDPNIMAPGGWISRCDLDGKEFEFFAAGMRNSYDFDFNSFGDILVYDSDMEWDIGAPWYRPTRVLALTSGGEYGWRNGTGKWPDYYPDSLPAVANTGKGSPTGVVFGYKAKFPAKYQHAFYACDWAYGTLYAVHVSPQGAGYTATFEPFCMGKGWDVTDIVIGNDGAMYVTIGGRGTQSGLYRITYTGSENTSPAAPVADAGASQARDVRRKIEAFHGKQDPAAISAALPLLNSPDRYIRFAARVALEFQPVESWKDQVLAEKRPTALINGVVGLVRASAAAPAKLLTNAQQVTEYSAAGKVLQPAILDALNRLDPKKLSEEQQLELIRAYDLCFIRMGRPAEPAGQAIAAKFDAIFPSPSNNVNRDAVQLLTYLGSPNVISKSMALMTNAPTQEEQFHYAFVLRNMPAGWTLDQRKAYFGWINHAATNYKGGASFKKFLTRIKEDAAKSLTAEEKTALDTVLKGDATAVAVKTTKPRQFVRNWQMQDLLPEIEKATAGRDFAKGKEAYEAAQCAACHRFGQDGGATGPDLTGVGNRFAPADSLEAILLPSKVISDQYQTYLIETADGDVNTGRITYEDDNKIELATNPFSTDTLSIAKKDLKAKTVSKVSMMPQGLLDQFSKEEIFDLIAYLRSAGDAKDKAFK